MKGCFNNVSASGLRSGFFLRMYVKKFFNSIDPFYISKSWVTILDKSSFFFILKAFYPVNNSWHRAPIAQESIFLLYCLPRSIYGERYKGVPQRVDLNSAGE